MKRRNPAPPSRLQARIERASSLFEQFTGHAVEVLRRTKVPDLPPVAVVIGHCDGIMYSTVRDGKLEKYVHEFRATDRPLFAVSDDGRHLLLLGGNYDFTERGVVDHSDRRNR